MNIIATSLINWQLELKFTNSYLFMYYLQIDTAEFTFTFYLRRQQRNVISSLLCQIRDRDKHKNVRKRLQRCLKILIAWMSMKLTICKCGHIQNQSPTEKARIKFLMDFLVMQIGPVFFGAEFSYILKTV